MITAIRDWLLEAWYRPQGSVWLRLLMPLEWLYRLVVWQRWQGFQAGRRLSYRAAKPVIVVGNITLGGTGKTPLILWLIQHLRAKGLRVGVVSRGYGAHPPAWPWPVLAGASASLCGDEPLLIVERTGVPMFIDPQRPRAVAALLAAQDLDLVLSDDGLQHYPLARDLELVLMDARRGLGNGHCLPVGPLREPAARLQTVDAVLWNGLAEDSPQGFGLILEPVALVAIATGQEWPLSHLPQGQVVHAVAGIGYPQRFFNTLEQLHWRPLAHPFEDHAQYTAAHFAFEPHLPLIMTEKDAVKCRSWAAPDWYYLKVQARPSVAFVDWLDKRLESLLLQHS